MATNLYVGNLPYDVASDQLLEMFTPFGEVVSARVITDRDSGRSKGFGFVEMGTEEGAQAAIAQLNNTQLRDRTLTVNEARPREERPDRGSGGRPRRSDGYSSDRRDRF
jgi:RNA recognition motif-containing protein